MYRTVNMVCKHVDIAFRFMFDMQNKIRSRHIKVVTVAASAGELWA